MTDPTETATPAVPATGDPEWIEDTTDPVALSHTGWARLSWDGRTWQLRRPFFGELRDLRMALEGVTDAIGDASDVADKVSSDIMDEARAVADAMKADGRTQANAAERRKADKLKADGRKAARSLIDKADQLRIGWWECVFQTLCVDKPKVPEYWPSWIVNPDLPHRLMEHWRANPLGHGG